MNSLISMAGRTLVKNAPRILATIGIGGVIGTAVLAVKGTPEAEFRVSQVDISPDDTDLEIKIKKVKAAAPAYLPAIGMGALTIASFLGAQHILSTRQAAAAMAATIAETALKDYSEEVVQKLGSKKDQEIREAIAERRLEKAPSIIDESIVEHTGSGDVLCYDSVMGRYFRSSTDEIRKAENVIVKRCTDECSVCLNDFYEELGLRRCRAGDKLCWNVDGVRPDIHFSTHLKENIPVIVLNYSFDDRIRY